MSKFMNNLVRNRKKGFTLVELIVVLVILAILLAILVPALTKWIDKAKEKQVMIEARSAYLAVQTIASEAYGGVNTGNVSGTTLTTVGEAAAIELAQLPSGSSVSGVTIDGTNKVTAMTYKDAQGNTAVLASGNWKVTLN